MRKTRGIRLTGVRRLADGLSQGRRRSRTRTAVAFGLMIGCGVLMHLKHATAYALVAIVLVSGSIAAGVAIGALYGISRAARVAGTPHRCEV